MSGTAYTATQAVDVVAIFDSDYNQLFAAARPTKVRVNPKAKLMSHPLESGALTSDYRIFEPIEIEYDVTLDRASYVDAYNQIKQVFYGTNLIAVQTNVGLFPNMCVVDMPHDETTAVFDTVTMKLRFKEVQFYTVSKSALPASATNQKVGNVTGQPASTTQTNAATAKADSGSALYQGGKGLGLF